MKISLASISASLLFMTWLGQVQLGSVDYRYKRRGPPPPPRSPPIPQYIKKWDQHRPPRGSPRPRPIIPMHVVSDVMLPPVVPSVLSVGPPIVQPIGPPLGQPLGQPIRPPIGPPIGPPVGPPIKQPIGPPIRPTSAPIRNFWKNTKAPLQTLPEKDFHYSPPISNIREFDYHIQTNSIPTHNIPIKQLGEKGPIHTIPAPNLSLADKPIVVEEHRPEPKKQPQQQSFAQQQKQALVQAPQYQVTEPNEGFNKNGQKHFREQQVYFAPDVYANTQSHNYDKFQQSQVNKQLESESFVNLQDESRLSSKELYQLLSSQLQQQQQQQLYEIPSLPQALLQQQPQQQLQQIPYLDYQAMLAQSQLFQPETTSYLNQLQQVVPSQNSNNQAQFHAFTSERHAQGNFPRNDEQSTFITTDYNLKAEDSNTASYSVVQDPNKSEPNLPYVQEIFELGEENTASGNKVEQNIKDPKIENKSDEKEGGKVENLDSAYYATLPNRQAAETLASLQAAGKVNSNLMQVLPQQRSQNINQRTPLEIYVPDTHSFGNQEIQSSESLKNKNYGINRESNQEENISDVGSEEYGDGQENEPVDEQNDTSRNSHQARSQNSFGSRIRPKQSQ